MIKKILLGSIITAILIPVALFYSFKVSPLTWNIVPPTNNDSGIALRGYDPIAYFADGKALHGDPDKGLLINGLIYRFSTDENRLTFKTFPERYLPQYGGYCATAISNGFTADADPEKWLIVNDKLYLFFSDASKSDFYQRLQSSIILKADSEWVNHQAAQR